MVCSSRRMRTSGMGVMLLLLGRLLASKGVLLDCVNRGFLIFFCEGGNWGCGWFNRRWGMEVVNDIPEYELI